ncbi:MAG: DUF1957 domain-containing protein [Treponema sp.]|nr:DUF1957 domain-containing protein [Treponema sp.]MCL2251616.1 DUF1957 domain-containing protein [Treponema sp.]
MEFRYAISLILEAHVPFVREYSKEDELTQAGEEGRFFQFISEAFIPLLEVLTRLENDHVPYRVALVISPILCHMLNDEHLQKKYIHYIDKQIEFGSTELERTSNNSELNKLAQNYYNQIVEKRAAYLERYEKNLLKAIDFFRRKGKIEILASSATHAFLPFISQNHESLQAQMEIPNSIYRRYFGSIPQGFWLPSLGWTAELEPFLRSYNYSYTILNSHGLLLGNPAPEKGCFYPAKTPNGTFLLARDLFAGREIKKIAVDEVYRNNDKDIGYELPPEKVSAFLTAEGRHRTGYSYWSRSNNGLAVYNQAAALDMVNVHTRAFLENTIARLTEVSKHMKEIPISINAYNAGSFGHFWYEGTQFIETLFRMAAEYKEIKFVCPSEYIFKQNLSAIQIVSPELSSSGLNGYAETWLDASNDWIYRHLLRAMERMTELAERFPDDTGLKERALNQAAREILLAQSSDWPALLHRQDSTEYARSRAENSLRNFTTIYEALGSNYISTEWLTKLERKHNIFPNINYRVFRRKK